MASRPSGHVGTRRDHGTRRGRLVLAARRRCGPIRSKAPRSKGPLGTPSGPADRDNEPLRRAEGVGLVDRGRGERRDRVRPGNGGAALPRRARTGRNVARAPDRRASRASDGSRPGARALGRPMSPISWRGGRRDGLPRSASARSERRSWYARRGACGRAGGGDQRVGRRRAERGPARPRSGPPTPGRAGTAGEYARRGG
jgi:hypothetical protein